MNINNEVEVKELIKTVDKQVNTLAKVRLVRRALRSSRFIPTMRSKLTPEVRDVIEDFLKRKEVELSK